MGPGASALAQTAAVHGFVRDASSGEPLAYANVYLDSTEFGSATSDKGYYYISNVPAGRYVLAASFIGYRTVKRPVTLSPGQTLDADFELAPGAVEMGEVKVTGERARFEREVEVSAVRLDPKQLVFIPKVGGEVDLFRTIQTLPGVISTSDFSNRLYIRGGSPDQNLILLDGITVYNPSHLFGLFSPFIPEAVSDVTLLAGGFPAKYGGRLSSVLDVTTREGNSKRYTGDASLSMIAGKAQVEGPIPWGMTNDSTGAGMTNDEGDTTGGETGKEARGSFLFAARRTWLPDLLLKTFGVKGVGYYFYDAMGKVGYEPAKDSRLTVAGIVAQDVLDFWDPENRASLNADLRWGNRGVSLRWNRVFSPILYGEVVGAWSNFRSDFKVDMGTGSAPAFKTDLTDWTVKGDLTWYAADRHTLGVGVDAKLASIRAQFSYDTLNVVNQDTLVPLAAYAEDQMELVTDKLFVKPGVRLACDPYKRRLEVEPRLGVKYRPAKNTAVNAAVGRFTQPMVTLNSTDALFSIYDIWVSVPKQFAEPSATHYIAGVEQWLRRDAMLQCEVYYKDYSHLLETRYGDYFTPPDSLLEAEGYSYGAELMLRRTEGWVNGWVSYSYMWTERRIGDEVYHPHYDRRHSVNVVATFPHLLWGVDVSAKWTLGTGLPYAGVIGYYPRYVQRPDGVWREWVFLNGPRDAFRYPLYHRLDAGLTKTWTKKWGEITAFLDVTNVYNAKNVLLYYWEVSGNGLPVRKSIGMIPILPTLGVKVKF